MNCTFLSFKHGMLQPSGKRKMIAPLFGILEVPGSNLGSEISYPDREFCGFLQSLQANAIVPVP
jgi:hypothetical protein